MITKDSEILNDHATRMEFRDELLQLMQEYLPKLPPTDLIAELEMMKLQIATFIGNNAFQQLGKE